MNSGRFALVLGLSSFAAAQTSHTFRITGAVVSSIDRSPVRNASVSASPDHACSRSDPTPAQADPQGQLTLSVPCAGIWRLSVSAPGFATQAFEQHGDFSTGVVLTNLQPEYTITFPLAPTRSITGFVFDEAGDPVRNAQVSLLDGAAAAAPQDRPAAESGAAVTAHTITDDRGLYEFADLSPGSYLVAVQAQPWYASAAARGGPVSTQNITSQTDPNLDLAYPITFYPDQADPQSATVIHPAPGTTEADIHLSPVPSIHLLIPGAGRLVTGNNPARRPINVPPIQQVSILGHTPFNPTSVSFTSDGSVDIGGLAPGNYATLRTDPGGHLRDDQQLFTIQKDGPRSVEWNSVVQRSGSSAELQEFTGKITGTVLFQSKPSVGAMLLLVPATLESSQTQTPIRRQQSNTDGSFLFEHVAPGKYILVAIDHGWNVAWSDPAVLPSYLIHGVPLAITDGHSIKQTLEAVTP
jgi:hypothetical protein